MAKETLKFLKLQSPKNMVIKPVELPFLDDKYVTKYPVESPFVSVKNPRKCTKNPHLSH